MKNALIVYKKSMFELYKDSPDKELREFVISDSSKAKEMRDSHHTQQLTLEMVVTDLAKLNIAHQKLYRADLNNYKDINNHDIVITVGGDGTLLEVSHYIRDIPIMGVNSDTNTSKGYFSCCNMETFEMVMRNINSITKTKLNRLEISINNIPVQELVLNDVLFADKNPAGTTSYEIKRIDNNPALQRYRNSGILVCTAAGSTARMFQEGGHIMPLDSDSMQYHLLGARDSGFKYADYLQFLSWQREGTLYIDGPHLQYNAGMGDSIAIRKGPELTLVGNLEQKRKGFVKRFM